MAIVAIKKHISFFTYIFDFGLQHQVIWNTANGNWFASSLEVKNFLGDHFSPALILVSIIYRLIPSDITLLFLQPIFVGLSAIILRKILKKYTDSTLFINAIPILFMIYMGLSGVMLSDFHEIVLAIPFLFLGIYYYDVKKKFYWSLLFFGIAALAKEEVGIFIGSLGLFWFIDRKDKKALILTFAGYIYSVVALTVLIPLFRENMPSDTITRYSHLGSTPSEIVKRIIFDPVYVIQYITKGSRLVYIAKLLLPVGFIPLLNPLTLLIVIPVLLINLLSISAHQVSAVAQYDALISVGIFYSLAVSLKRFEKFKFSKILFVFILAINVSILFWHPMTEVIYSLKTRFNDYLYLTALDAKIPRDAVLATSNAVGAHFGNRINLQIFYPDWNGIRLDWEYIIVDKKSDYNDEVRSTVEELTVKDFKIIEENDSFIFLKRS